MKVLLLFGFFLLSVQSSDWLQKKENGYTIYYTAEDEKNINGYNSFLEKGIEEVKTFFSSDYPKEFKVYVHPDRNSLDSAWRHDWKMPDFKSECWMVASGVAKQLDIISPERWDSFSCEHNYKNKQEVQSLITHELVHVFHGQFNKSIDFQTENLDWFVEGLAAYASGQLNKEKIDQVKKAIGENAIPVSLNDFWKGKLRYQLSGSVVLFIDKKFGRKKLTSLLPLTTKSELLSELNITEEKLLSGWKNFMLK